VKGKKKSYYFIILEGGIKTGRNTVLLKIVCQDNSEV